MITPIVSAIASACHIEVVVQKPVTGGDINECYCLEGTRRKYFLKLNEADRFPALFETEAEGLEAIRATHSLSVPAVLQHGTTGTKQWLLLEWIEKAPVGEQGLETLGRLLARLHRCTAPAFGWHRNNYIGSLQQQNTSAVEWADFYTDYRLTPLVKKLVDQGAFSRKDSRLAEKAGRKIAGLFPGESPALLHGDLWAGNYMISTEGKALVFDPAVYYGHREMDIGMTSLFGGFNSNFYAAYEDEFPLEKGWRQRLPLTQLYPVLLHAVLFGGHYINSARNILTGFGG